MQSVACREIQRHLYDFICQSFKILSKSSPSKSYSTILDIWMTYILPWNSHKDPKSEMKQLSDPWILFIKQNLLFYLQPTAQFLEYVKMNINTATREQDLLLFEKFISHFTEFNLYTHIQDAVSLLLDVKSGGFYTNQTTDCAIIQRHCGAMDVNICHFSPLFSNETIELPLEILNNLSNDIVYCLKYLPENSQVSRIEKLASQFATLFKLESKWEKMKPNSYVFPFFLFFFC